MLVKLELEDNDAGQIVDALETRKQEYEGIRDYYLGEAPDGFVLTDDCDLEDAEIMIDVYSRLIDIVFTQLQEQREQNKER